MPRPLATRLLALLLSLLYLVVGLTGQSGHYWLEAIAESPTDQAHDDHHQGDEHGQRHGYRHCHGPDNHWHYHSHDTGEEQVGQVDDQTDRNSDGRLRFQQGIAHQAHDCPLLSVVSNLKLSWSTSPQLIGFEPAASPLLSTREAPLHGSQCELLFPRGPPLEIVV